MLLKEKQKLVINNRNIIVDSLLGSGGQGDVYLVEDGTNKLALKIYKKKPSEEFIMNLKNNIIKGSPSVKFLWPKEYVDLDTEHVGYLMDIRPSNFVGLCSYLNGFTPFKNKRTMIDWCILLCQQFKLLHEKGYSYQDLNDGSLFLDPISGDILICDNDNVTTNKNNLGILGMMRFMAPEIVRGESMPDTHSDRFSLSVILFMTICLGDPFEGDRLKKYHLKNEVSDKEMYGINPVYIYSSVDASNRPIRGYHKSVIKRYPLIPDYIKAAFHKTFVDGLTDRENSRVTEIEWIKLLNRYSDELITCSCGEQYAISVGKGNCPHCNLNTREYTTLNIGSHSILLEPGKKIYMTHINKYSSDYAKVIGVVIQNKNNPRLWGIRLSLDHKVSVKDTSNNTKEINENGVIPILDKLIINFTNDCVGEINRSK